MANKENIIGKGFDKRPENINKKGRPPKLIKSVINELKDKGYEPASNSDVIDAYTTLMQLPQDEIQGMINDKSQPMFIRVCAKRLVQKDGFEIIEKMIDRAHGKASQSVDLKSSDGSMTPKGTTLEYTDFSEE